MKASSAKTLKMVTKLGKTGEAFMKVAAAGCAASQKEERTR